MRSASCCVPSPIDVEQHVAAFVDRSLDGRLGRAIEVVEHARPLEQLALVAHGDEVGFVDEVVVAAVDLAGPRLARRHRHGKGDARITSSSERAKRGFAGSRRRRQHEQQAAPVHERLVVSHALPFALPWT